MRHLWILGCVGLAACANSGTETGNAFEIAVPAISSEDPVDLIGLDAQGSDLLVETARASVRRIDFEIPAPFTCDQHAFDAPVTCDDAGATIRVHGPYVLDLVEIRSTPSLTNLSVPRLPYDRVDVRFQESDALDELLDPGDPLLTHTLRVTGQMDYNGPINFELTLDFTEDARFDGQDVDTLRVLLELDVAQWFDTAPITQCLDDGDLVVNAGTVLIADSTGGCSDIENSIKDAIRGSGALRPSS